MPTKAEQYAQMAEKVAVQLTGSWQEWAGFLTTAARLYKYPFHEQLMIYAQRPDATACAEYDLWNNRMGRYVRRGSKGIALVDDSGDRPRLRYVFDISDTGTREHSRTPWLWKMGEEHAAPVMAMLERNYDVGGGDLAQHLADVATKLTEEYWAEHRQDILYIVDGSFLEEYDEYNIEVQFKSAATVSITYALMSRCGLEPEQYFGHEDFMPIFDFNTPATIGALGTAVSQVNQQVLRQIGVTIQNFEREKRAERSVTHGEQPDLHEERRLPDSRPEAERAAGEAPGQVRQDAENLSEGASADPLQPAADDREAVPASHRDRRDREQPPRTDDAAAGGGSGRDRGTESPRPDGLGGPDEHLQGPSGGNPADGTYQQLSFFPSEAEQIQRIEEAESVKTPSAFSMPEPAAQAEPARRTLVQNEIDAAIQEWNGSIESKHAVVRYMKDHAREKDTAAWLRQEFGDDLPTFPVTASGAAGDVPWPKVQRRIAQLIADGSFLSEQEQQTPTQNHSTDYQLLDRLRADCDYFLGAGQRSEKHLWAGSVHAQIAKMRELYEALPEKPEWLTTEAIDNYAERMAPPYQVVVYHHFENGFDERQDYQTLEEAERAAQGYVNGTMEPDGFAYDGAAIYDLQQRTYLRIFGNYPDEAAQAQVASLDLSGQPITREGDTLTIGSGEPTHEMDITVSDEEYEAIQQAVPEGEATTP